ncbi:MAG TPA: hypothetical protein VGC50_03340 [Gammaproteobacteria bacterium]|jgi:hypothetical protein
MAVEETDIADEDDEVEEEEAEAEATDDGATDNVGDPSVEINIEELIHELESESGCGGRLGGHGARHRLEDLMENRRSKRDLEDFDDYKV